MSDKFHVLTPLTLEKEFSVPAEWQNRTESCFLHVPKI